MPSRAQSHKLTGSSGVWLAAPTPRKVVEPEQDERLHWGSSTQLLSQKRPSAGLVRTRLERVVIRSLLTAGKAHPLTDVPLNSVSVLTTVSTGHQGSPGQSGKFSEPHSGKLRPLKAAGHSPLLPSKRKPPKALSFTRK